jgi:hypothetical protein
MLSRPRLLLEKVARRIKDDEVMRLLKLMLTTSGKQGVPQGGVVTPLTQKAIFSSSGHCGVANWIAGA